MKNFEDFILANENADCSSLLMRSTNWPESPLEGVEVRNLCVDTIEVRRRLRNKLPLWHADPGLVYPNRLCGEQCSSESTSRYKASLARQILSGVETGSGQEVGGWRVADLTGGLGADSFEFSKICDRLLYNEANQLLCAATRYNFDRLGARNVDFSSVIIEHGNVQETLAPFSPDLIYLDPARRSGDGRKVFLLEDCSPDLLTLKDELLAIARHVLVKLSPMADISMLIDRLGSCVREVHIVGSGGVHGECKELLVWMQQGWTGGTELVCVDADATAHSFRFTRDQERSAKAFFVTDAAQFEADAAGAMLFEPSSAMMKAGPYKLLGERFGIIKLGRNVQLYIVPPQLASDELRFLGKLFSISCVLPFGKAEMKSVAKQHPGCEVTTRNLPLTSEDMKNKMGVRSGSSVHVFGVGCDFENRDSARYIIVCKVLD